MCTSGCTIAFKVLKYVLQQSADLKSVLLEYDQKQQVCQHLFLVRTVGNSSAGENTRVLEQVSSNIHESFVDLMVFLLSLKSI